MNIIFLVKNKITEKGNVHQMNKFKAHLPVDQNSIWDYYKMWAIVSFKFHQVSNQCHDLARKKYKFIEGTHKYYSE